MDAGQFTKNILDLDDNILFAGIAEKSGHLNVSNQRINVDDYLKGRNLEMIVSQAVNVVDLRKMFTSLFGNLDSIIFAYENMNILMFPVKDHVLLVFANNAIKTDVLIKKIRGNTVSSTNSLDLYSR
ncbi:MAG: hypothetical protein M3162_05120 [Thermoproteota archaeon]|nr:hypothetical protein [Thermoproteota archaeon]